MAWRLVLVVALLSLTAGSNLESAVRLVPAVGEDSSGKSPVGTINAAIIQKKETSNQSIEMIPSDEEVTVSWRVVTRKTGLRLRLYSNRGIEPPILLSDRMALLGNHEYRLLDVSPHGGFVTYDLRVVDEMGNEISLGTLVGVVSELDGSPLAQVQATSQTTKADIVHWHGDHLMVVATVTGDSPPQAGRFVPRIPTPPPRVEWGWQPAFSDTCLI